MEPKLAEQLLQRLSSWNTLCFVECQPAYHEWLVANYAHWRLASEFGCFRAETIDSSGWNMLWKDDVACLIWFSPSTVMETQDNFIRDGLLPIGASPNGDWLVLDTFSKRELEAGFVLHEDISKVSNPRQAYHVLIDTLLEYMDKLHADPSHSPI